MNKVKTERLITPQGYQELEKQLEELEGPRRREIAEQIKAAREFGDISENAEYEEAKNEQAMLEARISRLRERLQMAEIVDGKAMGAVGIGTKIIFEDQAGRKEVLIVGHGEADPANGRLSIASPIGAALASAKAGEEVKVRVPSGNKKLKVIKVS